VIQAAQRPVQGGHTRPPFRPQPQHAADRRVALAAPRADGVPAAAAAHQRADRSRQQAVARMHPALGAPHLGQRLPYCP
jgi:hypothetical protein